MIHLLPLKNRILGKLDFEIKSPLHIGTGEKEVRNKTLRIGDKVAIISSSLKGSIRSLAGLIARKMTFANLPPIDFDLKKNGIKLDKNIDEADKKRFLEWFAAQTEAPGELLSLGFKDELKEIFNEVDPEKIKKEWGKIPEKEEHWKELKEMGECYATLLHPLYRLFGSISIAAKVRFIDTIVELELTEKTGVAIDRESGKASEHRLYFLEAVKPNQRFSTWFIADNLIPHEEDSKLFANVLNTIKTLGLSLGARKSCGMGQLELLDGNFWIVELDKDSDGTKLANPFKEKSKNFDEFVNWLGL